MIRQLSDWTMYAGMGVAMVAGATWPRPSWGAWAVGLAIVGAGVALRRLGGAPAGEEGHEATAQQGAKPPRVGTLDDALTQFAEGTAKLATEAQGLEFEAIKRRCEDLIWVGPERVGQAQEGLVARVGFATYAEVMAPLATAERWLYRAWSASSDGHRPEAVASVGTAAGFAAEAARVGAGKLTAQGASMGK